VQLANHATYGLVASVLSPDLASARRIADQLHSCIIHINDQSILHEVYGPIGVGASGNGYYCPRIPRHPVYPASPVRNRRRSFRGPNSP
jgi:acyl-CoA reductase-like NAD-dependent aldehyde dehydrogenase